MPPAKGEYAYASDEEKVAFAMGFVGHSEDFRSQYVERWQEILENFTVGSGWGPGQITTSDPFRSGSNWVSTPSMDRIFLKDPETHQTIMTYASKLVRTLFGDVHGEYIQAVPVGWEDAAKAETVTRLLRYAFCLPGTFRSFVEAIVDMLLFGTSIVEVSWRFDEREMLVRAVEEQGGIEVPSQIRQRVPVYDDVQITPIDVQDFYPDPGEYRIERMRAAAKRFQVSWLQAKALADRGLWREAQARRLEHYSPQQTSDRHRWREDLDQPSNRERMGEFRPLVGYEFWGEVPWADEEESSRRVLTIVGEELVRDDPWPLADAELPFKTLTVNPVCGRFYGISPGEVIRYDQDFADVLKELIARAVIRSVHPPIAFDADADMDIGMLRRWRTDMPIPVRGGPAAIGTLRYDANIPAAMSMLGLLKQNMEQAGGAMGAIQGEAGPAREPATAAAFRVQSAMDRPELAALVLERDAMPAIGRAVLRRYQQFLNGREELASRIGELPEGTWLGDIYGDYDVEFRGSRLMMTRQQRLQAWDRLIAMAGAIPELAIRLDWSKIGAAIVGRDLELPEVAADMANPQVMMQNMMISG